MFERRETVGSALGLLDVFGTRQEMRVTARDPLTSDQSGSNLIQLESLILAQNERWRQA